LESPEDSAFRRNVTSGAAGQFKVGVSTYEDVVLALGEPDAVSPDGRKLLYRTRKTLGILVVLPLGSGPEIKKDVVYTFEFDAHGRLESETEQVSHPN
jgi:outer membrane protein assembly factor BamE (lipoprotein component of BamABCDE complex)